MASASGDGVPPEPFTLRSKPQKRGNVGVGKRYSTAAEFDADVEVWERERDERRALMNERERALDRLRDRSGRQRDGEGETDGERRVRQRQETAGAAGQHAQREAARRKAKRKAKQEAWAHDVAVFAGVFDGFAPRFLGRPVSFADAHRRGVLPQHPLAYRGFRKGWWLKDVLQIRALHAFITSSPPTGEEEWEASVDRCAVRLWRSPTAPADAPDIWHPAVHLGDGYCMLLSLPSALPSMRTVDGLHDVLEQREALISPGDNEELARRGFEPLAGWEPVVQAGYMPRPPYFELSPAEVRRRRARFYFEDAFAFRSATISAVHFLPGIHKTLAGDRSHHAWRELKAGEACTGCRFHICRCEIGIVLDARMLPVEPKRAAKIEQC